MLKTTLQVCNSKNEIILNTPKRNEILMAGPPQNAKSHLLGKGAYGTVFKAVFNTKQVAVKVIKNTKGQQFPTTHNEANILGWEHPNIIQIFKIESTTRFGLVIMERFVGQCLQSILDSIELPLVHRTLISLDIVSALNYCHNNGLLHLDVKPQNIMISFRPNLRIESTTDQHRGYISKLCDFGSSMQIEDCNATRDGCIIKGTVRYMSPEALRREALSPASDIYSLGVTMWQLKYRKLPYFHFESNETVAYQVVKNNLRPDSKLATKSRVNLMVPESLISHRYCLCDNFSADQSYHSLEYVKNTLNCIEEVDNLKIHSERSYIVPRNRSPLSAKQLLDNVNKKSNVKCNLRTKLNYIVDPIQVPTKNEKEIHLNALFQSVKGKRNVEAERNYKHIYRRCWCSDPKLRISSVELHKCLSQLL